MACKVVWTTNAEKDYENIINYLDNEWSRKISDEFAIECLMKIELLSVLPLIGTVSNKSPYIRKFLITKHNFLYYKLEAELITLLNFIDTRKEPPMNPFN